MQNSLSNSNAASRSQIDVIIIGAGLAGLAAAVECEAKGLKVLVLEASTRVGGRVWSEDFHGTIVDWGAEWIIPSMHPQVKTLVDQGKLSLNTEAVDLPARWNTEHGSFDSTYDSLRQLNPAFEKALQQIELDARIFLSNPSVPEISLREYLKDVTPDAPVALLEAAVFPLTGAAPETLSNHMLWHEIGFHDRSIHDTLNAKACRISEGCDALAKVLQSKLGDSIQFKKHVTRISTGTEMCEVDCAQETFQARLVICAVPLMTLQNIDFDPLLPATPQETANNSNAGRVAKAWAICKTSFPPQETLNSEGPLRYGYARRINDQHGLLCGQILSDGPSALNSKDAASLIKNNWPQAEIIQAEIVDWPHEPLARASWHSSRVGWAEEIAAFQNPIGNLHFAGGDIAPQWAGWMEGAILSGQQAAARIVRVLQL